MTEPETEELMAKRGRVNLDRTNVADRFQLYCAAPICTIPTFSVIEGFSESPDPDGLFADKEAGDPAEPSGIPPASPNTSTLDHGQQAAPEPDKTKVRLSELDHMVLQQDRRAILCTLSKTIKSDDLLQHWNETVSTPMSAAGWSSRGVSPTHHGGTGASPSASKEKGGPIFLDWGGGPPGPGDNSPSRGGSPAGSFTVNTPGAANSPTKAGTTFGARTGVSVKTTPQGKPQLLNMQTKTKRSVAHLDVHVGELWLSTWWEPTVMILDLVEFVMLQTTEEGKARDEDLAYDTHVAEAQHTRRSTRQRELARGRSFRDVSRIVVGGKVRSKLKIIPDHDDALLEEEDRGSDEEKESSLDSEDFEKLMLLEVEEVLRVQGGLLLLVGAPVFLVHRFPLLTSAPLQRMHSHQHP